LVNFKKIGLKLRELSIFQDNVEQSFKQVNDAPFIRGKFFEVTMTAQGSHKFQTGFKQRVVGWVLVDTTNTVLTYRVQGSDADELAGIVTVNFSGAGTYKLWIF